MRRSALALSGHLVTIGRFCAIEIALAGFTKATLVHVVVVSALVAPDTRIFFFTNTLAGVNIAWFIFNAADLRAGALATVREGVVPGAAFFALGSVESLVAEAGEGGKSGIAKLFGCSIL